MAGNYLESFGNGDGVSTFPFYAFPTAQTQLRDNFADLVPRTVRLPGASGGFDQFGVDAAPQEIGNVSVTFVISIDSGDRDDLQEALDEINAMAAWGVQKLVKHCGGEGDRECYARVNNITRTEAPAEATQPLLMTVTVDFQVASPGWRATANSSVSILTADIIKSSPGTPNGNVHTSATITGTQRAFPSISITQGGTLTEITALGLYMHHAAANVSPSVAFDDCHFKIEGLTGLAVRNVTIDCESMTIVLDRAAGDLDGFPYVTHWDFPNFISIPATGSLRLKVFVIGGGTAPLGGLVWRDCW